MNHDPEPTLSCIFIRRSSVGLDRMNFAVSQIYIDVDAKSIKHQVSQEVRALVDNASYTECQKA
jgi:hypothetical protein